MVGNYDAHHYQLIFTWNMNAGNQIITLPSAVQTSNVQLQWRALLNAQWSLDNVRIGSDALLYYLQFEIQVGSCLPPPINGSTMDYINLEYYDGITWSLLQDECLHPKCFSMVMSYYNQFLKHIIIYIRRMYMYRTHIHTHAKLTV